jgi:hypothetical protein
MRSFQQTASMRMSLRPASCSEEGLQSTIEGLQVRQGIAFVPSPTLYGNTAGLDRLRAPIPFVKGRSYCLSIWRITHHTASASCVIDSYSTAPKVTRHEVTWWAHTSGDPLRAPLFPYDPDGFPTRLDTGRMLHDSHAYKHSKHQIKHEDARLDESL